MRKTELVFLKPKNKQNDYDLNKKLAGIQCFQTPSVKYLGIKRDANLNWKDHQNSIAIKLNKANAILLKLRKYVNENILKSIYYSIFESHLNYCSIVWSQNVDSSNRLFILQKKAIRTISFAARLSHTSPLFSKAKILKLYDKVSIQKFILISNLIPNHLPVFFQGWFFSRSSTYNYHLRSLKSRCYRLLGSIKGFCDIFGSKFS